MELNLRFPDADHVIVRLGPDDDGSPALPFVNPITATDLRDLQWYVETYGVHSLGDPDDTEAARVAGRLPVLGQALFRAAFGERDAQGRFDRFQAAEEQGRLLTISTEQPAILALPWELLNDPASRTYLFLENPRISVRRRVAGAAGVRGSFALVAKDALRLLFVVSRPEGVGFLDPRADALPVLTALDERAPGRVVCEFLRPPTVDALVARLEDRDQPPVDILHFDGHGVFDRAGGLPEMAKSHAGNRFPFDGTSLKERGGAPAPSTPANTGYLLFETADGTSDFVSAEQLGSNLHRHRLPLVILSACQSAAVAEQAAGATAPMGSVAARLTATGIPAVIAMTHSVLVPTTQALFGAFYHELAGHKAIGEALDNARRHLFNHPEKYEVQRGTTRVPLRLSDWFLPALYQPGADGPLLLRKEAATTTSAATPARSNLRPAREEGFVGRRRELWQIERWFAGPTRRITVSGFGGQGKTALAEEAGRWLLRTRLVEAVVFVTYAQFQGLDAEAQAVNQIGSILGESLIDAAAARTVLEKTRTLVVLDNLEALTAEARRGLLDAAVGWSEAGGSRVLCTTRQPDMNHPGYRVEGTLLHRRLQLAGLGSGDAPDEALELFARLQRLPPAPEVQAPRRDELIALFEQVSFHPLSIRVLAQQLKTRRPAELGARLEQLLAAPAADGAATEDTPAGLLASLTLSLDRLDVPARAALPRLGVLQGGAFEDDLVAITGLDKEVDGSGAGVWASLRRQLEAAGLIEAEAVPGVNPPFLRFHPTLASLLWAQLDPEARTSLGEAHRARYYKLSGFLYDEDSRRPHEARAIAWRELPNLLHAVHAALDAGDADAAAFANNLLRFLSTFGLTYEAGQLLGKAQATQGEVGSEAWYLSESNRADQLIAEGQAAAAADICEALLEVLASEPTYERAVTLVRWSRALGRSGRPDLTALRAQEAVAVCDHLQQTDQIRRLRAAALAEIGDAFTDLGQFKEARQSYEDSLRQSEAVHDLQGQAATLGQLGTLSMLEGHLDEAVRRFRDALVQFQRLREPHMEATAWHQLGRVFEKARQWDEAERHYRESARLEEELGNLSGAAMTWNQMASVNRYAGKPAAAEGWYRKAIEAQRIVGNALSLARALSNLANLLVAEQGQLDEARRLAEEALALKKTLDPGAADIWTTYSILADIADSESDASSDLGRQSDLRQQARDYRRLARQAQRAFAGTRHEVREHAPLILRTVGAVTNAERRQELEQALPGLEQRGWTKLVAAIRLVLAGERDEDALCDGLDSEDMMIVGAILQGLADPSSLNDLLPSDPPASE
jgi:tetratricopeptide (TPR) repeat protein